MHIPRKKNINFSIVFFMVSDITSPARGRQGFHRLTYSWFNFNSARLLNKACPGDPFALDCYKIIIRYFDQLKPYKFLGSMAQLYDGSKMQ